MGVSFRSPTIYHPIRGRRILELKVIWSQTEQRAIGQPGAPRASKLNSNPAQRHRLEQTGHRWSLVWSCTSLSDPVLPSLYSPSF